MNIELWLLLLYIELVLELIADCWLLNDGPEMIKLQLLLLL